MKKILIISALFAIFTVPVFAKFVTGLPQPTNYVNDFADVISQDTENEINAKLDQLKKETSAEVAVVTVKTISGTPIEEYTIALAEEWRPGTVQQDNGVIMFFAMEDRLMRIEVGQGLEDKITDVKAKEILDNVIKPEFKTGNYDSGVTKGVTQVSYLIAGQSAALVEAPVDNSPTTSSGTFILILLLTIAGIFVIAFLASFADDGYGGGFGSGFVSGALTSSLASGISSGLSSIGDSDSGGSSFGGFSGGSFSGGGASSSW